MPLVVVKDGTLNRGTGCIYWPGDEVDIPGDEAERLKSLGVVDYVKGDSVNEVVSFPPVITDTPEVQEVDEPLSMKVEEASVNPFSTDKPKKRGKKKNKR